MKQLNKPSDNLGGLLKIWAVPPADITIGTNSVILESTSNIVEIYCSPGSMSFSEKQESGKAGISYKTELRAFIPKDTESAQLSIDDLTGRKWVVIYLDQNEQYKIAGTVSIPLRVAFDLDTGSDTSDLNGHSVLFYGQQLTRAVFISDPFTE